MLCEKYVSSTKGVTDVMPLQQKSDGPWSTVLIGERISVRDTGLVIIY